ncbi:MAG: hypothetical protein L0154_18505 [Chloroflexi bacterium]|nr:hypothetical protein [Chloroflexota bacterium]
MKQSLIIFIMTICLPVLACSLTTDAPEPTPIPPTFTPASTSMAQAPTGSSVPTATPTTTTVPPTATATLPPTSTPLPTIQLAYDTLNSVELDAQLRSPLDGLWVSFRNVNDRQATLDVRTPQVDTGLQTIYLARPGTSQSIRVMDLPASVEDDIYWSPNGRAMVYFLREGPGVSSAETGLYVLNLDLGSAIRFFDIDSLQPRGIPGHRPIWSPDGKSFLMVMSTAYATDVFVVNVDGSNFTNLTESPAFDFWATWSPDGTKVAFVSDRATCPTREPDAPGTCDSLNFTPPQGGNLYLLDVETLEVQKVNDTLVTGPPQWIDNRHIATTSGSLDPLVGTTELWIYDTLAGSGWQVSPADDALYTAPSWQNTAEQVAYQRAGDTTTIVLADRLGDVINQVDRYNFPRFGLSMDWAPDNDFLAIGGRNGQCPYGIIVLNQNFELVTAPATNLLACDPVYSPNGRWLAFMGISPRPGTDAQEDLYIANANGLGATNITNRLQGQVHFIGWVGNP